MKRLTLKKYSKDLVKLEMENEEYSGKVAIRTLNKNAALRKRSGKAVN